MVNTLCKELILRKDEAINSELQTVYLGGGTPSILSYQELQQLFHTIFTHYKVSPSAEITLEANPDDFFRATSPEHFLKQTLLQITPQYFDNITIDLIYGIPRMSKERWQENINKALSFDIPHISAYALTVEEKTALYKFIATGKIAPISDEQAYTHFQMLIDTLGAEGFIQYEFSNFGKEGYFSRNNTAYWFGKPYMGIGPSAHSFNGKERSWNIAHNIKYIQQIQQEILPQEKEELTLNNRYNELIITRIRTMVGIDLEEVRTVFGEGYRQYLLQQAQKYLADELLVIEENHLKVTRKGRFLSDGIASDLFRVDDLI